jgi:tetratricopeptide (TPR) repeat protein
LNPEDSEAFCFKGYALFPLQRYEEAIQIDPYICEAYSSKGLTLRSVEKGDEALEAYKKVIEINPFVPEAYYNKSHTLQTLNRNKETLASLNKTMEVTPNNF